MKSFFLKISSLTLAFLVLFSTFSFTVEKHFCGDFLVDISYFGEAQSCSGEIEKDSCEEKRVEEKKKCCKDEIQQIDGQDDFQKTSIDKITFKFQKFVVAYTVSYKLMFKKLQRLIIPHKNYSPPSLYFNFQVLHEVFII